MIEKRRKKRIRYLLILVFLTSLYLTTAAYSWFSTNRTVYISELSIKVQAQGGIEISANAIDWSTKINQADIINANATYTNSVNQLPKTMEPVSTGKVVSNGKLQLYHGYTENNGNDYILLAQKDEEKEGTKDGRFMAFDIFLKADNETHLYLSNSSGAFYQGITPGIENSVRFAFLVEGNVGDKTSSVMAQNLNNATTDTTYIWEPNYDSHSVNGIKNALEVYGLNINNSDGKQILYDGLISNISKNNSVLLGNANAAKYPNLFKRVNVDFLTKKEFKENIEMFTLNPGITKVRIYIWIEGQDVDCENKSAIGDIEFNFQLTSNPS